MPIKKSQLYSSIWETCDELRGGMDASQYKDYVLTILFVKYVSDKYAGKPNSVIQVPSGASYQDIINLRGKPDIGDKMNKIITKIFEANDLGVPQADFNAEDKLGKGKDMIDRLSKLVAIFNKPELDFSSNRAEGDDILGDAYEYLMRHFATESGKSKGQFYTPSEVSRIMAKVIGIRKAERQDQTIYDPTCGSGSLLLKASDEAESGITIYGQENDNATAALARMNMILHNSPLAEIEQGNTLSAPHWKNADGTLKTFDFVVANPPFSNKSWSHGIDPMNDAYQRFSLGIPPTKNGDYAFLLHVIRSLKSTGKGAIILPHGVLFRGNSEADIRKNILQRGYIKGIIGLPANLFYGTGIPACIVVLDKEHAETRKGIFMIDASMGFVKDGNKNRLRAQDVHKIVDVFNKQIEIPKYSRLIPMAEIEAKEWNLNIPRYIDGQEAEDIQNIEAHLKGGIPDEDIEALQQYWRVCPTLRTTLFVPSDRAGFSKLNIAEQEIQKTILSHPEFTKYAASVSTAFVAWKEKNDSILRSLGLGAKPKEFIHTISEDILACFAKTDLIDKYDIYQHMMSYWYDIMQDDAYLIASEGWKAVPTAILDKNGKPKKDEWECDLVPKQLVIHRYFADQQKHIEDLTAQLEVIGRKMEEMIEEQSGEEGLLESVVNEKGKITKGDIKARMKEAKGEADSAEELGALMQYQELMDEESDLKSQLKKAEAILDATARAKYATLTESEVKTLVVEDKWQAALAEAVHNEMDRISQRLTNRIRELAKRYETPLPDLMRETERLSNKVDDHLRSMGFKW